MIYGITKKDKSLKGKIQLTPSKSISNRALIIRSLCPDHFRIQHLATATDTHLLQKLLDSSAPVLNAEDAGTTFRFLTAYLAQKPGEWLLTGTERMQQRPIGILVEALRKLGAEILYVDREFFPPLKITGKRLHGSEIEIDGSVSSQFISALLLIAPTLKDGLKLNLTGEIFSFPYIEMTLKLMSEFGIRYEWKEKTIVIAQQSYQPENISVEPDWSAASYWYEMAAFADDADLLLEGLQKDSVQGDSIISELMKPFGVQSEFTKEGVRLIKNPSVILPQKITYDFQSCPDLVQTMAVTCAGLGVEAEFTGVKNLRIKETDRLNAIQNEFKKIAIDSEISDFGFRILNSSLRTPNSELLTHNDHRMAMAFAPLSMKWGEVKIENPDVVNKSYPEFWNDLEKAGFGIKAG